MRGSKGFIAKKLRPRLLILLQVFVYVLVVIHKKKNENNFDYFTNVLCI